MEKQSQYDLITKLRSRLTHYSKTKGEGVGGYGRVHHIFQQSNITCSVIIIDFCNRKSYTKFHHSFSQRSFFFIWKIVVTYATFFGKNSSIVNILSVGYTSGVKWRSFFVFIPITQLWQQSRLNRDCIVLTLSNL